jgi:GNAT superfamily N-acetyltransferase
VNQTQVLIRPPCDADADADAVHVFLAGLSAHAQYQRFFTGLGLVSPTLVRRLVAVTPRQQAMLALIGPDVVGHAMWTAAADGVVELGVVVGDRHRGHGVATRLLRALGEQAPRGGMDLLRLDVLCENQQVINWIQRRVPGMRLTREGCSLTGVAPLPARESRPSTAA